MSPPTRRILAAFLLGALAGAALIMGVTAARVERATVQRDLFMTVAREQRHRLDQMKIQLEQFQTRPAVESVELHFVNIEEDKSALALALAESLRPLSTGVIGEMVEDVNPAVLRNLYHHRIVLVNRSEYVITVETIVIAPSTHFFLSARPRSEAGIPEG
ncbi:MAG: hypothetical protein R6U70_01700 [Bacillota bacterium]